MNIQPTFCPNPECENHAGSPDKFFWSKGTFTPKCRGHALARYQCKLCKATFSNRTFTQDQYQKRSDINRMLSRLMSAGVTLRDSAWILETTYKTVCRRAAWLADRAREAHEASLASGEHETSYVQFDEMQTFEHAKAKALTVALAVRHKTGKILSAKVGRIPANGKLAAVGQALYGWTVNESPQACAAALAQVAVAARPNATVACDGATTYPNLIWTAMPLAGVLANPAPATAGGFDPLFKLNHACAKIRAKVAVMARRTWSTTKSRFKLQDKLDIFVAVHNGYDFC